jgi:ribonuclease R
MNRNIMSKKKAPRARAEQPARQYKFEIASRDELADLVSAAAKPLTHEQIAQSLAIYAQNEKFDALGRRLNAMVRDGQLVRNRRGAFLPVDEQSFLRGRVSAHPDGFGFLVNERGGDDIYLNARQMRSVLDGDRVVVQVTGIDRRGRSEGAVIEVIERANLQVVGRLRITSGVGLLTPDNKRLHQQIVINSPGKARDGQIVVAEIIEQPTTRQPPIGKVIDVLGEHLSPGMEIDIAIHSHGIPAQWPEEVLRECAQFDDEVDPDVVAERRDLRRMALVTIDGEDARDFDDAVYAEKKDYGWRLVVAIADVSAYVATDTALDAEALNRGTSVYFPRQVVPMLPEQLSNGLCSLNPDVDRLCMVCDMAINHDGSPRRTRFYPATMRSKARLTYTRVHQFLEGEDESGPSIPKVVQKSLRVLYELFGVLRTAREERGAIDFETGETQIIFNAERKIESLQPIVRNDAHLLIEECMIAANIAAARYLDTKRIPGLYRIHEHPGEEKLADLRKFLGQRELSLAGGDSPEAIDYANTLAAAADRPDVHVIQTVLLRSMNRAVYSTSNHGHFGLALDEYAHFTSPIRRYPDLMVHRAIKHVLTHKRATGYHFSAARVGEIGEHCSTVERRAEQAVRDVVAWLKCEYAQEHIGDTFSGVVSAVTSFGLFIELDDIHVEGLVHISSLPQDYYDFDPVRQGLQGRRSGQWFQLGQVVSATIMAVNLEERKIDLQLSNSEPVEAGRPKKGAAKRGAERKQKKRASGKRSRKKRSKR